MGEQLPNGEFQGEKTTHFKTLLSEILAERLAWKKIELSTRKEPGLYIEWREEKDVRNIGDQFFTTDSNNYGLWINLIGYLKTLATVFLTMAMAAVGISINLSELKSMGYKPFVVGLIAAITVGFISLIYIETLIKFI